MWSENSNKITKKKVMVRVWVTNGRDHEGYMFVKPGERLSDLLNDQRDFLPFVIDEDTVTFLRKSSIVEVEQTGEVDDRPDDSWKKKKPSAEDLASGPMDPIQAAEILGLCNGYSRDDVLSAYRQMIQKVHPDHGGSTFLATQVNAAKRVLLQEYH